MRYLYYGGPFNNTTTTVTVPQPSHHLPGSTKDLVQDAYSLLRLLESVVQPFSTCSSLREPQRATENCHLHLVIAKGHAVYESATIFSSPSLRDLHLNSSKPDSVAAFTICSKSMLSDPKRKAADAGIKVPSVENTELKGSPFGSWSR